MHFKLNVFIYICSKNASIGKKLRNICWYQNCNDNQSDQVSNLTACFQTLFLGLEKHWIVWDWGCWHNQIPSVVCCFFFLTSQHSACAASMWPTWDLFIVILSEFFHLLSVGHLMQIGAWFRELTSMFECNFFLLNFAFIQIRSINSGCLIRPKTVWHRSYFDVVVAFLHKEAQTTGRKSVSTSILIFNNFVPNALILNCLYNFPVVCLLYCNFSLLLFFFLLPKTFC